MAQALLHDPEVLIMDEPTSGLDPNQIRGVRQLIRDLGQSKTVLVSTHILQEVEPVADRVLFIHDGKIVFDGKPARAGQPEREPRTSVLRPDGPAGLNGIRIASRLQTLTQGIGNGEPSFPARLGRGLGLPAREDYPR